MYREIDDILNFRSDISPFLVHLTKGIKAPSVNTAKEVLQKIIESKQLRQSSNKISDVKFGVRDSDLSEDSILNLFCAICFTETPLNEIHGLLEIRNRQVNLEPYGLVFIKESLRKKHIAPVIYLNNYDNELTGLIHALGDIVSKADNAAYLEELYKLFPLISSMGYFIQPKFSSPNKLKRGFQDFSWEREWRLPHCFGNFELLSDDIFVGLCMDEDIDYFEDLVKKDLGQYIPFIDPRLNAKWYAKKLIDRKNHFGLTVSVV